MSSFSVDTKGVLIAYNCNRYSGGRNLNETSSLSFIINQFLFDNHNSWGPKSTFNIVAINSDTADTVRIRRISERMLSYHMKQLVAAGYACTVTAISTPFKRPPRSLKIRIRTFFHKVKFKILIYTKYLDWRTSLKERRIVHYEKGPFKRVFTNLKDFPVLSKPVTISFVISKQSD